MQDDRAFIEAIKHDRKGRTMPERVDNTAIERLAELVDRSIDRTGAELLQRATPLQDRESVTTLFNRTAADLYWVKERFTSPFIVHIEENITKDIWKRLLAERNPVLIEQLGVLFQTLRAKELPLNVLDSIIDRCIESSSLLPAALYLYSLDHALGVEPTEETFVSALGEALAPQDAPQSIRSNSIIAEALLTSTGEVNLGLIPCILEHLPEAATNHQQTLQRRLLNLYRDHEARAVVPLIRAPAAEIKNATSLLRLLHNLPPQERMTDQHARSSAIAAYLSHMRQPPPNGCFAMVICQTQLENSPKQCFEDFRNLLATGMLKRRVHGEMRSFPFLLATRGEMGVDFRHQYGLLTMWHNAIAGMAEGDAESMIRTEIIRAVIAALDAEYSGLKAEYYYLIARLMKELTLQLQKRIFLCYDPSLQHEITGNGGFVLYDRIDGNALNWKPVDSLEKFRGWLSEILISGLTNIMKEEKDPKARALLQQMVKGLIAYLPTDGFVDRLLVAYMDQRVDTVRPSQNIAAFVNTPWATHTGNDTENNLRAYHSHGSDLKSKQITPSDGEELFRQLKDFYELRRRTGRQVPNCLPGRVEGIHALTLIPLAEDFTEIKRPAANYVIAKSIQIRIIKQLRDAHSAPEIAPSEEISASAFRNSLLEKWNAQSPASSYDKEGRARIVDTLIIQNLPESRRRKLLECAVPIADSHWSEEGKDIYFYLFPNPFSGKIELWRLGGDLSNPSALNPHIWIKGRKWEVFYF